MLATNVNLHPTACQWSMNADPERVQATSLSACMPKVPHDATVASPTADGRAGPTVTSHRRPHASECALQRRRCPHRTAGG